MSGERRLKIGSDVRAPGWELFNAIPGPDVDHVGDAKDMSQFPDDTFDQVYASHVLEHFDYTGDLSVALAEWHRILEPGGQLLLSVPDLDTLAEMFIAKDKLNVDERFFVMRMIFGGHTNEFDYHVVGLNEEFVRGYLRQAGFNNATRVAEFGLFNDTSAMLFKGVRISVNLIAEKGEQ
ncbi:MAG: class I SAM-dependent methyltransferase [Gammaproteobacteria bacterium]